MLQSRSWSSDASDFPPLLFFGLRFLVVRAVIPFCNSRQLGTSALLFADTSCLVKCRLFKWCYSTLSKSKCLFLLGISRCSSSRRRVNSILHGCAERQTLHILIFRMNPRAWKHHFPFLCDRSRTAISILIVEIRHIGTPWTRCLGFASCKCTTTFGEQPGLHPGRQQTFRMSQLEYYPFSSLSWVMAIHHLHQQLALKHIPKTASILGSLISRSISINMWETSKSNCLKFIYISAWIRETENR